MIHILPCLLLLASHILHVCFVFPSNRLAFDHKMYHHHHNHYIRDPNNQHLIKLFRRIERNELNFFHPTNSSAYYTLFPRIFSRADQVATCNVFGFRLLWLQMVLWLIIINLIDYNHKDTLNNNDNTTSGEPQMESITPTNVEEDPTPLQIIYVFTRLPFQQLTRSLYAFLNRYTNRNNAFDSMTIHISSITAVILVSRTNEIYVNCDHLVKR